MDERQPIPSGEPSELYGNVAVFPNFILPRTKTKRRIFRKLYKKIQLVKLGQASPEPLNQTLQSYLGYLSHANAYVLMLMN